MDQIHSRISNPIKVYNIPINNANQEQDSFNNTISGFSESIKGKNLLPLEKEKEEESFSSIIKKNNLLFEEKDVSFMKLYSFIR